MVEIRIRIQQFVRTDSRDRIFDLVLMLAFGHRRRVGTHVIRQVDGLGMEVASVWLKGINDNQTGQQLIKSSLQFSTELCFHPLEFHSEQKDMM